MKRDKKSKCVVYCLSLIKTLRSIVYATENGRVAYDYPFTDISIAIDLQNKISIIEMLAENRRK